MSVMRQEYYPLDNITKSHIDNVKALGEALHEAIDPAPSTPREKALAKTKLEEAIMWSVKGQTGAAAQSG